MWSEPLFSLLGWSVDLYVIFIVSGALVALECSLFLGWERGIPSRLILALWAVGVVGMIVGGVFVPKWFQNFLPNQGHWSLSMLAAILLSKVLLISVLSAWRPRLPELLDIGAPGMALGQSIGRLGCFAAGCCYGTPAPGLPWAVTFQGGSSAERYPNVPVHPFQLYEALGCLFIALLLFKLRHLPVPEGTWVLVYLVSFGTLRFFIEFFRGDPRPMVGILSLNQIICLGFIAVAIFILTRLVSKTTKQHIVQYS